MPIKIHKKKKLIEIEKKSNNNIKYIIPSIQQKNKKYTPKHKFTYNNQKEINWKMRAGIVSTKVMNKQIPQLFPKSQLNIQQRTKYVTLKNKLINNKILNEIELNEYNKLKINVINVINEQNIFKQWLFKFYMSKDEICKTI